jgi:hypothetical protein
MCLATIDYESGTFWVPIAALGVSAASFAAAVVALFLAKSSLTQAQQVADRDLRNWTQRKWFDLYEAAEKFCLLLEQFQAKYDQHLETKEFIDDVNALTFAARRTLPFASVFPQNPTVDAFFACINKWKLDENLFSKKMLEEYQDAIEGFRQKSLVHGSVIGSSESTEEKRTPSGGVEREPMNLEKRLTDLNTKAYYLLVALSFVYRSNPTLSLKLALTLTAFAAVLPLQDFFESKLNRIRWFKVVCMILALGCALWWVWFAKLVSVVSASHTSMVK